MNCSGCGRAIAANHRRPVRCRFCGVSTSAAASGPSDDGLRMLPLVEAQRAAVCHRCVAYSAENLTCGVLVDRGLPGRIWHPRGIPSESAQCPLGRWSQGYVGTIPPDDPEAVAVVTTHWNPAGHASLAQTYAQWRPTLGELPVRCVELLVDDAPQEIPGSDLVLGTAANALWQKERMINRTLGSLGPEVRYLAWLDHDLFFESPHWLRDSIELLEAGYQAVQPFDRITYLGPTGRPISQACGGMYCVVNAQPRTAPGGAWIARVDWLRSLGGLFDVNIVGGGDEVFFAIASGGINTGWLDRQPPALREASLDYTRLAGPARATYLAGTLRHVWHGDRSDRQYVSRDALLSACNYDPARDIEPDPATGLYRWTDAATTGLREGVRNYFAARKG